MRKKFRTRTRERNDSSENIRRVNYADRFYRGHNRNKPADLEDDYREPRYRSDYENPLEAEEYHGYARHRNEDGVWNLKFGNSHGRGQYEKGYHGEDHPYGGRITHSEFGHQGNRGYHDQDVFEENIFYDDVYTDYDRNADEDYGYDEYRDQYQPEGKKHYRTEGYAEYEERYFPKYRNSGREQNYSEWERNNHDSRAERMTSRRRRQRK
jgi:hypothetical protein